MADAYQQIGPFSRTVGVSADVLRAWERRYGLPRPRRSSDGRRLYGPADARLVNAMRHALERELPAAEPARVAAEGPPEPIPVQPAEDNNLTALKQQLASALDRLDEASAQDHLARLFGTYSIDAALSAVVLPYLRELGERWACGRTGIGHEHFATTVIHGRLLSLTRKWDAGHGPRAVLAAPAGEQHTLGLLCFGLALRARGWRISYLGADTPLATVLEWATPPRPARVVLASVRSETYVGAADLLVELANEVPVAHAGAGARRRAV